MKNKLYSKEISKILNNISNNNLNKYRFEIDEYSIVTLEELFINQVNIFKGDQIVFKSKILGDTQCVKYKYLKNSDTHLNYILLILNQHLNNKNSYKNTMEHISQLENNLGVMGDIWYWKDDEVPFIFDNLKDNITQMIMYILFGIVHAIAMQNLNYFMNKDLIIGESYNIHYTTQNVSTIDGDPIPHTYMGNNIFENEWCPCTFDLNKMCTIQEDGNLEILEYHIVV